MPKGNRITFKEWCAHFIRMRTPKLVLDRIFLRLSAEVKREFKIGREDIALLGYRTDFTGHKQADLINAMGIVFDAMLKVRNLPPEPELTNWVSIKDTRHDYDYYSN